MCISALNTKAYLNILVACKPIEIPTCLYDKYK